MASGRFVLLHDPDGVEAWSGDYRAVVFIRATLEPDLATDPLLTGVAWAWLLESWKRPRVPTPRSVAPSPAS